MSLAVTIHDGCESLVDSNLLCIIVFLIYLSIGITALHMYYFTLSSYESVILVQIYGFYLN